MRSPPTVPIPIRGTPRPPSWSARCRPASSITPASSSTPVPRGSSGIRCRSCAGPWTSWSSCKPPGRNSIGSGWSDGRHSAGRAWQSAQPWVMCKGSLPPRCPTTSSPPSTAFQWPFRSGCCSRGGPRADPLPPPSFASGPGSWSERWPQARTLDRTGAVFPGPLVGPDALATARSGPRAQARKAALRSP